MWLNKLLYKFRYWIGRIIANIARWLLQVDLGETIFEHRDIPRLKMSSEFIREVLQQLIDNKSEIKIEFDNRIVYIDSSHFPEDTLVSGIMGFDIYQDVFHINIYTTDGIPNDLMPIFTVRSELIDARINTD